MTGHDKKVYVGHEDTVWIIVGVTLDLLCSHSFSENQFPLVIINGLNMVLRCSFECTSLHILTGFNNLIVNLSFPTPSSLLHCKPKLRDKITTFLSLCLNCAVPFLLGSFICALRDEHMFSLDPFCVPIRIITGTNSQNTVQDMSAGHSQTDRYTSSELSKTDNEPLQTSAS